MSIIIDDNDVCPKCGAYWCGSGYCCNGHESGMTMKDLNLTKSEQAIYDKCRGNCKYCLADGGCDLQNKLEEFDKKKR